MTESIDGAIDEAERCLTTHFKTMSWTKEEFCSYLQSNVFEHKLSPNAISEVQYPLGIILQLSSDRDLLSKAGFEIIDTGRRSLMGDTFQIVAPLNLNPVTDNAKPFPEHSQPNDIIAYMRLIQVLRPIIVSKIQSGKTFTAYLTHFERQVLTNAGFVMHQDGAMFECTRP